MGQNKALLPVGNSTFIEEVIGILSEVTRSLLIIANIPEAFAHLRLPMHPDIHPGVGPLGGIHTGLSVSTTKYNLFLACDMLFTPVGFLRYLVKAVGGFDGAVPKGRNGYEPLCAVYSKTCLRPIERQIEAGHFKVIDFFEQISIRTVGEEIIDRYDPDGTMFMNINTKADYRRALSLFRRQRQVLN